MFRRKDNKRECSGEKEDERRMFRGKKKTDVECSGGKEGALGIFSRRMSFKISYRGRGISFTRNNQENKWNNEFESELK